MSDQTITDEDLMLTYQTGDHTAFETLYRRYHNRVSAYIQRRVFDPSARVDVVQEVFLKLHKARHLYSKDFPFAPWLFTICKSVLVDHLKRRSTQTHVDLDSLELASPEREPSNFGQVASMLEPLAPVARSAMQMRYSEDLDFDQIARRLNTSPTNVRQIISRAIRKLRGTPS